MLPSFRITMRVLSSVGLLTLFCIVPQTSWAQTAPTRNTTQGAANATGADQATTDGEIDTSAGSSENIEREFNEGFVGQSDNTGRFVGNEQAGPQQQAQRRANFQQRNGGNVSGGEQNKTSKVRPVIRLGIEFQRDQQSLALSPVRISPAIRNPLATRREFSQVQISWTQAGKIVLQGNVRSERDKKLAEAVVKLEPGVREVANQLIVLP